MVFNWLAVVAAALSSFVLGGLWYGPLFGATWMKAAGISAEQVKNGNKALIFGGTFVLSLIAAATFAFFLGSSITAAQGALCGFTAGLCWVTTSLGSTYLFEHKPLSLFLINGGYRTVQFTLIGLILGAWR
ncbi:MAG: DUF1761 domain-containing protein [Proteobacteria bacterium]|nr:DUF1761 domain-containing protein [Pseudomonadota bacterium]